MVPVEKCFSVLGSALRIRIIEALKEKPASVSGLSSRLKEERSNVSHSLAMLKRCNFVVSEKKGRQQIYSLSNCIVNDMKKTGTLLEIMEMHAKHHCHGKCRQEEAKK